jgi:haloalkane dehalogenase
MPSLIPIDSESPAATANRAAWEVLKAWHKPFLCAFTDSDPLTAGADRPFLKLVPGTRDQPHRTIEGARHFVQEDAGPALARIVIDLIERTP